MKKFIKKEWFKIIIIILLSVVVISYASGQYVYYQKQQIQLQEMRQEIQREQKAKEKFRSIFLEIRKVGEKDEAEAMKIINSLTDEEYRIYELLRAELD